MLQRGRKLGQAVLLERTSDWEGSRLTGSVVGVRAVELPRARVGLQHVACDAFELGHVQNVFHRAAAVPCVAPPPGPLACAGYLEAVA